MRKAPIKLMITRKKKVNRAWLFFSLPDARGLLDLRGWSLSSSKSLISFRTYAAPDIRQKRTKASTLLRRRGVSKTFSENISGAKIIRFLIHCFMRRVLTISIKSIFPILFFFHSRFNYCFPTGSISKSMMAKDGIFQKRENLNMNRVTSENPDPTYPNFPE